MAEWFQDMLTVHKEIAATFLDSEYDQVSEIYECENLRIFSVCPSPSLVGAYCLQPCNRTRHVNIITYHVIALALYLWYET